jgi:predicted Zn-dependent protease
MRGLLTGWRLAAGASLLLVGCASLTQPPASPATAKRVASKPVKPREEQIAAFDRKRDEAQLAAARDRANQGDFMEAEELLAPLVKRSPELTEARLLLADVYLALDRPTAAEEQLRAVLDRHPDHAAAHYALGLLHDVAGRETEAAEHFRRAGHDVGLLTKGE